MTATYLQVTVAIWGFLAATAVGIVIHTVSNARRSAAFDRHAVDALALFADCWPEPEHDDDVTRCECGVLWTADRTCPHDAAKRGWHWVSNADELAQEYGVTAWHISAIAHGRQRARLWTGDRVKAGGTR